jgi:hypothetical protein
MAHIKVAEENGIEGETPAPAPITDALSPQDISRGFLLATYLLLDLAIVVLLTANVILGSMVGLVLFYVVFDLAKEAYDIETRAVTMYQFFGFSGLMAEIVVLLGCSAVFRLSLLRKIGALLGLIVLGVVLCVTLWVLCAILAYSHYIA